MKIVLLFSLIAFATAAGQESTTATQQVPAISVVLAAGKVSPNKYENSFLGLAVDAPHAEIKTKTVVDIPENRARLVQIFGKATEWDAKYNFAVLADKLSMYPQLQGRTQYVRSVRHKLEQEGLVTVRQEFDVEVSGVPFTGAVMQEQNAEGRKYYRGLYSTFRFGYILSFDIEGPSETRVNELISTLVHFEPRPLSLPSGGNRSSNLGAASPPSVSGVTAPRLKYQTEPQVPSGEQPLIGTVVISAIVGPDGKVHSARVVRSLGPKFDDNAVDAVKQWLFDPAMKDGRPVAVAVNIEVKFRIAK